MARFFGNLFAFEMLQEEVILNNMEWRQWIVPSCFFNSFFVHQLSYQLVIGQIIPVTCFLSTFVWIPKTATWQDFVDTWSTLRHLNTHFSMLNVQKIVGACSNFWQITYGSVIKLMHEKTKFRLHSHDVPYGSGSGQQSVTGFSGVDDANSYWVLLFLSSSLYLALSFDGFNLFSCNYPFVDC